MSAIVTLTGRDLDLILDALNWVQQDEEGERADPGLAALVAKLEAIADTMQASK